MRAWRRLGSVVVLALWSAGLARPAGAACPARPNIILFLADDLGWMHLPFFTPPIKWVGDQPDPGPHVSRGPRALLSPTLNRLDARLFAAPTGAFGAYVPDGSYPVRPVDRSSVPADSYALDQCDNYPACNPAADILHGSGGLKQIAEAGMVFTRFYATATVCAPTRASLMSGQHGYRTLALSNSDGDRLEDYAQDKTIARYLKEKTCPPTGTGPCYMTGLIGKWNVTTDDPHGASVAPLLGFDEVLASNRTERHYFRTEPLDCYPETPLPLSLDASGEDPPGGPPGVDLGTCANADPGYLKGHEAFCDDDISPARDGPCPFSVRVYDDLAANFIDRHAADGQPFFLVVAFNAVHTRHRAPARTVAHYKTDDAAGRVERGHPQRKDGRYWALLEEMDAAIGRVLKRLDEWGLTDETLVMFTSDQGPDGKPALWGDPFLAGKKDDVEEGGIRVPFIASACGGSCTGANCRTDRLASHVDLLRTIADAAGVSGLPASGDHAVEGQSLWAVIRDEDPDAPTARDFAFAAEEGGTRVTVTTRKGYATKGTFHNVPDTVLSTADAPNGICGYEGAPTSATSEARLRGTSAIGCTPNVDNCSGQLCTVLGERCVLPSVQVLPNGATPPRCLKDSQCDPTEDCKEELQIECNRCAPPAWKLTALVEKGTLVNGMVVNGMVTKVDGLYELETDPEEQFDRQDTYQKLKDELVCTVTHWMNEYAPNPNDVPLDNGTLNVTAGRSCTQP